MTQWQQFGSVEQYADTSRSHRRACTHTHTALEQKDTLLAMTLLWTLVASVSEFLVKPNTLGGSELAGRAVIHEPECQRFNSLIPPGHMVTSSLCRFLALIFHIYN